MASRLRDHVRVPSVLDAARLAVLWVALLAPAHVHAKAHLWRISEVYSNADGTIQFIELNECCGSNQERNLDVTSITSNANTYLFPNDLPLFPFTAFAYVLIATADFAALPGAPTPDYIIPDNFFDPSGDLVTYVGGLDEMVLPPGALPTDGTTSLHRDINTGVLTPGPNSPTNFSGVMGSVSLPSAVPGVAPWLLAPMLVGASGWKVLRRRNRREG